MIRLPISRGVSLSRFQKPAPIGFFLFRVLYSIVIPVGFLEGLRETFPDVPDTPDKPYTSSLPQVWLRPPIQNTP